MEMTPRCRQALNYANESRSRLGHPHAIGAHLLLGLLTLRGGVADNLLRNVGLSVQSVEGYLSAKRVLPELPTIRDGVLLGKSAFSALARAEAQARDHYYHTYLGIEHLLLGILEEEGTEADDLLASVHVDRSMLQQLLRRELPQPEARS